MTNKLNVIVVGLGHQSQEDHLPAIQEVRSLKLVGVVDTNVSVAKEIGEKYNVPYDISISNLLEKIDRPTLAIVALPHNEYLPVIEILAKEKIHIIKEKPFAVSMTEADKFFNLSKDYGVSIQVTLQRRFNPIFKTFCQLIRRVGNVHSVEAIDPTL